MLDPIIKTIEVPCSQERAFKVFLNEMDSWWPLGKFTVSAMGGAPAKAIRVEAKQGGKIVEIGPNGTEYLWGTIKSRSEEHTSELQSLAYLVCRLLLEKKKKI